MSATTETICDTTIGAHRVLVSLYNRRSVTICILTEGTFDSPDEAEQVGRCLIAAAERARAVEAQLRQLAATVRGENEGTDA